jgi:hypothetical protein
MGWQRTTFERSKLYEEVWSEAVTVVAKRYGVSDVGLRKICLKLDVPIPPRGYWAQVTAGQRPKKEPLPASKAIPTYVREVRVPEIDEKLEARLTSARQAGASKPIIDSPKINTPTNLDALGREADQIARATLKLKEVEGILPYKDYCWADVLVSASARERTLVLLDRLAAAIKAAGGVFDLAVAPSISSVERYQFRETGNGRGHFLLHGIAYFVRVKERVLKEEVIDPPPLSAIKRGRPRLASRLDFSSQYRPTKFSYTPSGQLTIAVHRVAYRYETAVITDTRNTVIDDKIIHLAERIEDIALRSKVQSEMQQEVQQENKRLTQIWEERKASKDALLKELDSFEKLARNLDRAESLRRLAAKINEMPTVPTALAAKRDRMLLMAAWLDPVVAQHWPEVDDVPAYPPHVSSL